MSPMGLAKQLPSDVVLRGHAGWSASIVSSLQRDKVPTGSMLLIVAVSQRVRLDPESFLGLPA